jgi:sulfotransferase
MVSGFVGVTGLPRAGSTLLCQMLAMHPDVHCEVHSSPLCNCVAGIRRTISDENFFLAQLDGSFDAGYGHLRSAMRGFLRGWYGETGRRVVVDKNRAWLQVFDLLLELAPEARLVVCLRELGQIYGSIEAQHQKTVLLDFVDRLADHDRLGRADLLFAKDKAIGAPLSSLAAVTDLPQAMRERLYFLRYEDLMARPAACMSHLFAWLGLSRLEIDPSALVVRGHESDSHYRMKYPHRQVASLAPAARHEIPERIQAHIEAACAWYYQMYYPELAKR